jgi:hypothetical protein
LGYNRSAACTILFNEVVILVDAIKRFRAIPAESFVILSNGAVKAVNVFEALTQTGTGKIVGDSK